MHHTVRQSKIYHACTHKISENTTIKTNSDTNIMLKDDQNSIQVRESTCQAEWYTMVSVCMWSDQNNHAKIRINTLSDAIRSFINNPEFQNLKWIRHLSMHQEILSVQSSVYNQEMSIHWSSNQMPRLLHSKFKLDPLKKKSPVESPFCGPRILAQCVSHSNGELNFYLKNWFLFD